MEKIKPTAAELDILNLLWDQGPCTVRDIHNNLSEKRDVFYTTTLKTMQVMHSKGYLARDSSSRSHMYSAIIERKDVERSLIDNLRASLFSGSTAQLVISALGHSKPTPEEIAEIRSLIDNMDTDENA